MKNEQEEFEKTLSDNGKKAIELIATVMQYNLTYQNKLDLITAISRDANKHIADLKEEKATALYHQTFYPSKDLQ